MKLYMVTACFGERFKSAVVRFEKQVRLLQLPYPVNSKIFTDNDVDIVGARNPAEFAWKPEIISKMLQQLDYGDVLVYLDIGCEFTNRSIQNAVSEVNKSGSTFLRNGQLLVDWIDPIHNGLGPYKFARDTTPCIAAGTLFLRKDDETLILIDHWNKWCSYSNRKFLAGRPDCHRFDQSILSALLEGCEFNQKSDLGYFPVLELISDSTKGEAYCYVLRNTTRFEFIKILSFLSSLKQFVPIVTLVSCYTTLTRFLIYATKKRWL